MDGLCWMLNSCLFFIIGLFKALGVFHLYKAGIICAMLPKCV